MAGPEESYNAAKAIQQIAEDMIKEYEKLAKSGARIMENIETSIGLYYQYKLTWIWLSDNSESIEYRDRPIGWWDKFFSYQVAHLVSEEKVPHPRREEAMNKLKETQGKVTDADQKFDYDASSIRDTITSLAAYMASWVDSYKSLTEIPFPEKEIDIPTSGDATGWKSPNAKEIYSRNVELQYQSHVTTEETITATLENCAKFLEELKQSLVNFTTLVRQQDAYYFDLATKDWVPENFDIGWIINKIGDIGTAVVGYQRQQDEKAKAMIDVMNAAVQSILNLTMLNGKIDGMSRSGEPGWPLPRAMGGRNSGGKSSMDDLTFQVQYFKDHINHWQDKSSALTPIAQAAQRTPQIQRMFYRWPSFAAHTASGLNELSSHLANKALGRGATAAARLAGILDTSIRTYLKGEELNTAEAKRLLDLLDS